MPRPDARVIAPPMIDVPPSPAGELATQEGRLRLNALSLIGIAGAPDARRAVLRRPGGEILTVRVGDRTPRGRVEAIGPEQVILSRAGKAVRLRLPD
ncbi:MAG: hypothetical protein QNJ16_19435 [Rhodobacter sp.]|nr:hypothetical protein [Rhodobacter sp.]